MKFNLDRGYLSTLMQLAVPIAIQNGVNALLTMLDNLMIGQLGETSVASAALANQVAFLLTFFMYGVTSGAAIFTAQYWGQRDIASIRKVLGICLSLCLTVALGFTLLAELAPGAVLSLYTQDQSVIALGAQYLQFAGASYLLSAVSFSFSSVLKGMGRVKIPMLVSMIALSLKAFFSYSLIFGQFGLPAMGVLGGAIGTLVARIVEFILMLSIVYLRKLPIAALPKDLFSFKRAYTLAYLKVAMPVVINEMLWATGFSIYSSIYAHISTQAIAAINIATALDALAFVLLIANSDAMGIQIGNRIGAEEYADARKLARRSLIQATLLGLMVGALLIASSFFFPGLYQVDPQVRTDAQAVMIIMGLLFWVRGSNLTLVVGIMRSGGDTRFSAVIDVATVWLVGIPLALLGSTFFQLPVWAVYLLVMCDEVSKYLLGLRRFLSGRWMHNLTAIKA